MVAEAEELLVLEDTSGGAMRGSKVESVPDQAVKVAILEKEDDDFWAPAPRDEVATHDMDSGVTVDSVKKSAPSPVIVLPAEIGKLLQSMRDDPRLSFKYELADRGQVLGTGAQHGVSANQVVAKTTAL